MNYELWKNPLVDTYRWKKQEYNLEIFQDLFDLFGCEDLKVIHRWAFLEFIASWSTLKTRQGFEICPIHFIRFITYLVGGIPTPLKNMSSSVGSMKFPIYGNIKNAPKHQTDIDCIRFYQIHRELKMELPRYFQIIHLIFGSSNLWVPPWLWKPTIYRWCSLLWTPFSSGISHCYVWLPERIRFWSDLTDWFTGTSWPETRDFPIQYGVFRWKCSLQPMQWQIYQILFQMIFIRCFAHCYFDYQMFSPNQKDVCKSPYLLNDAHLNCSLRNSHSSFFFPQDLAGFIRSFHGSAELGSRLAKPAAMPQRP